MCFHSKQSKSAQELENRFKASFLNSHEFSPQEYHGFQHPKTPVITNENPTEIQFFHWGIIPFWAKNESIKKNTLNARIETLHEKASFKDCVNNRCLILVDGFYEWQWKDSKGREKQKYLLRLENNALFAFAGIWSAWVNKATGEQTNTYSILTTEANELMSRIHNSKKRMPLILAPESEAAWLDGNETQWQNNELLAEAIGLQPMLF